MTTRDEKSKGGKGRVLRVALPVLLLLLLLSGYTPAGAAFWAHALDLAGLQHFTYRLAQDELHVHVIDVGKADAILIESPTVNLLLDTATAAESETVLRYLKARGVTHLDAIWISHPDSDHAGGLSAILEAVETDAVVDGAVGGGTLDPPGVAYRQARAGETYTYGDLVLTVLAPEADFGESNDNSLVLRLSYGAHSILLCGDIEADAEVALLASGVSLEADVLKVAHHGSDSSTSAAFLAAVSPQYAAISVGSDSSMLPRNAVLKRLNDSGTQIFRTDLNGSVVFSSDGRRLSITTETGGTLYEENDR